MNTMWVLAAICLLLSSVQAQRSSAILGGASSVSELGFEIVRRANVTWRNLPAYRSVGSGGGISSFINGSYAVAFSDEPMTLAQEASAARSLGQGGKFSFPAVIAVYGFFVQGNGRVNISMTWFDLYLGMKNGSTWSSFKYEATTSFGRVQQLGKLAGSQGKPVSMTPICRADNSGTTLVAKRFFEQGANITGRLAVVRELYVNGALDGSPFPANFNATKRRFNGGVAVCAAVGTTANLGWFSYSQRNLCSRPNQNTTSEIFIRNAAGAWIRTTDGNVDLTQILARTQRPLTASFADVITVFQRGSTTPPIASFIWTFVRVKYTANTTFARQLRINGTSPGSRGAVSIFDFLFTQANAVGVKFGFQSLGGSAYAKTYSTLKSQMKFNA